MDTSRSYFTNNILKRNGVRLGDCLEIHPMLGRKRTLLLNRTKYTIAKGDQYKCHLNGYNIELPGITEEQLNFELILCQDESLNKDDQPSRYLLKAIGDQPFRINGTYSYESFLERGDRVGLGLNRLTFDHKVTTVADLEDPFLQNLKVVESDLSVMIEGETGTGKSHLANQIHERSGRLGRFIHVNLSSFSLSLIESELFGHVKGAFTGAINNKRGAFMEADKGTLFLDEIDSLPLEIQTKILLFLDSKEVRSVGGSGHSKSDVRLIFASGQSLSTLVKNQKLRKDLYYRLHAGASITLPPLRQNLERMQQLCQQFAMEHQLVISKELIDLYKTLPWPGNIRQLLGHLHKKKVMTNGRRLSYCPLDDSLLLKEGIEHWVMPQGDLITLSQLKQRYVQRVFEQFGRDCTRSAKTLGVSTNTVRRMVANL